MRVEPTINRIAPRASGEVFLLEEIDVDFGEGVTKTFERWRERLPHSVMMVAITDSQEVILAREFAAGLGERILRLPTGRVENGESSILAARRELSEELGFDSEHQVVIQRLHAEPGHCDSVTDVVVLTGLKRHQLVGDEPEQLEPVVWPLRDLRALVQRSAMTDARSIAALYLTEEYVRSLPACSTSCTSDRREDAR